MNILCGSFSLSIPSLRKDFLEVELNEDLSQLFILVAENI